VPGNIIANKNHFLKINLINKISTKNSTSPTPPQPAVTSSPSAQNNTKTSPVEEEVVHLRKQLRDSEMTISEMRNMIEKLSMENSFLKTRVDSQAISSSDVHL
jgi:TolA-binding protein